MVHYGFWSYYLVLPIALAAIYLSEIAKELMVLRPLIELLAGIPSVVYGFFGLVIVPLIQSLLVYLLVKLL
jgi:phosphate transport system permease protein